MCLQSTDFHFPDIDVQLAKIQECALTGNTERADVDMNVSICSTSSEDVVTTPTDSTLGQLCHLADYSTLFVTRSC